MFCGDHTNFSLFLRPTSTPTSHSLASWIYLDTYKSLNVLPLTPAFLKKGTSSSSKAHTPYLCLIPFLTHSLGLGFIISLVPYFKLLPLDALLSLSNSLP
jgi:hypothetical protein